MQAGTRVLYGDSTPSSLEPDILDVLVRLVECAADVANAYLQAQELDRQETEGSEATDEILADLDDFQSHAEAALASATQGMSRPELRQHGADALRTVVGMVDGWRRRYLGNLEQARALIEGRKLELLAEMRQAIERFVLPERHRAQQRIVARALDGAAYRDEVTCDIVPGVRLLLAATDSEPEVPRKIRTLLGKGGKLQIGTKLSRLRKIEEPAIFSIDDQVILEARVEQRRGYVVLAKKPGSATMRLELATTAEGAMAARGTSPDGATAVLPESDAELHGLLWAALRSEADRIVASPARLVALTLDDSEISEADAILEAVERIVAAYRPVVAAIAERSPNAAELAIKHETPDGRREEVWVKRAELGRRLVDLPIALRKRVDIAQLHAGRVVQGRSGIPQAIDNADAGANSERIVLRSPPPPPTSGIPVTEESEDISLLDLDLLVDDVASAGDDECERPMRVRSREPS